METLFLHRGRAVTADDIVFIRQLIAEHPEASRRALSKQLCEAWNWRQPNGALHDMVCRGLLLALHRAGHIELPAVRHAPPIRCPAVAMRAPSPAWRAWMLPRCMPA